MRIGIDGRALTANRTGTGRYVLDLMQGLDLEMPEATFHLYLRHPATFDLPSHRWRCVIDGSPWARLPGPSWSRLRLAAMIRNDDLSVFWAAAAITPRRTSVPVVLTVFDVTHRVIPSSMPFATKWGHRLWFAISLREATRRVSISRGTAERIRAAYGVCSDEIVTPTLARTFDRPPFPDPHVKPYVLSVATREPRKNLSSLLQAMERLNERSPDTTELWLVGGKGWGKSISRKTASLLNASWCRTLGYVSDEELPSLYANAKALAFPSVYEGYGIPVAEAAACGTPIVATDIPEIREAAGNEAIFVGTRPDDILEGLLDALGRSNDIRSSRRTGDDAETSARKLAAQLRAAADTRH